MEDGEDLSGGVESWTWPSRSQDERSASLRCLPEMAPGPETRFSEAAQTRTASFIQKDQIAVAEASGISAPPAQNLFSILYPPFSILASTPEVSPWH
jgi:hypothetical protein